MNNEGGAYHSVETLQSRTPQNEEFGAPTGL